MRNLLGRKDLWRWLPIPDNCKNFSSAFSLKRKSLAKKEISEQPQESKPRKLHPLVIACRSKDLLDTGVVNSKAELARRMGMSRARVTQLLNLLKLPSSIVDYLANCADPAIISYFTERRLRPMTMAADKAEVLRWFSALLGEVMGPAILTGLPRMPPSSSP